MNKQQQELFNAHESLRKELSKLEDEKWSLQQLLCKKRKEKKVLMQELKKLNYCFASKRFKEI